MYWRVRAGIKNPDINLTVIPECITALVIAEDADKALTRMLDEFSQYNLFITSVQLANEE